MDNIFAPYNFIPFSDVKVPVPYKSKEELPGHAQVIAGTLTGRIEYEFTARTPISVGGERIKEQNRSRFCRDGLGRMMIPGSTVRGLVRSHAEILSFSYPDMIDDSTYMYRKFAGKSKKLKSEYTNRLKTSQDSELRLPDGVKAGWLSCDKDKNYYFTPVREFGKYHTTYFQIHERDLWEADVLNQNQYMYREKINKFRPRTRNIRDELKKYNNYLKSKVNQTYQPYRGEIVSFDYDGRIRNIGYGTFKGRVLNSAWMNGKTHHYLVSEEKAGTRFEVSKDQILDYERDYDRNKIQNIKLRNQRDFYALPERGEEKLFFYKRAGNNGKLLGFGPTPYFRIFYDYSVSAGIPMMEPDGYDYASAVFGYTGKSKESRSDAYKSRVSFSDALYKGTSTDTKDYSVVLSSPKGTAVHIYLDQTGKNEDALNTYNDRNYELRGYKFYWKKSDILEEIGKTNVTSHLETLPAGSVFKGTVHFENLREDELGLLLLSIRFNNEGNDSPCETYMIGGGKPYGFGQIEPGNIHLYLLDQKKRFTELNITEKEASESIDSFKKNYIDTVEKDFGIRLMEQPTLKVYKRYAEQKGEQIAAHDKVYMDLKGYASYTPLPTAAEVLNRPVEKGQVYKNTKITSSTGRRGVVWIAHYGITPNQRNKLISELGIRERYTPIGEWADENNIREHADTFNTILLPDSTREYLIQLAESLYDHVIVSIKKGTRDDGWRQIK